jgi:2-polyprenyl-3-methyl-5-hydroxy-6-metoxy-1,4-benzoquinol methylase
MEHKRQEFYDNLYKQGWGQEYNLQPQRFMRYYFSLREFARIIKKFSSNTKILDFGCGNGYFLKIIKNKFNLKPENLYGYEISKEAIKIAKENSRIKFSPSLKNKKSFFDIVLSIDVIEHIEDDLKILKEYKSLLKMGGFVIISTSLHNFYWNKMDYRGGHKRRYTMKELRMKLNKAGFSIQKAYSYGFPFGVIYHLLKGFFYKVKQGVRETPPKKVNKSLLKIIKKILKINIPFLGNQAIIIGRKK